MRKYIVAIFFLGIFFGDSQAQVSLVEDGIVLSMIQRHKDLNRSSTVNGWRVQIAAGRNREEIIAMKAKFLNTFPELGAEWTYRAPYYKLNAGAFRTKLEATELKYRIKEDFPNAYVIKDDKIKPSEFLR